MWLCPCHVKCTSIGGKINQRFDMHKMSRFTHRTYTTDGCAENWHQLWKRSLKWPNLVHATALNYLSLLGAEHPDEQKWNFLSKKWWNLRECCLLAEKLFYLPHGTAVKHFVQEADWLLQLLFKNPSLNNKSLKFIHVYFMLILQKPFKKLKAEDHWKISGKRRKWWIDCEINLIYK